MAVYFDGCFAKRETSKALLVNIPEIDSEPIWVPKSQIHDDSEVFDDGENRRGRLAVTDWWAEKEGWV
jgi:hypothetical protein